MKILIVEDEHRLSDNIRDYLAPQGYLCEQAFDYNQAKMMSGSYAYDCVLLDLMLPGGKWARRAQSHSEEEYGDRRHHHLRQGLA